jgi:hypothetical protein
LRAEEIIFSRIIRSRSVCVGPDPDNSCY